MGEYALHLNRRIKIGTCEDMLYLRWEDRNKVQPVSGSVDPSNETGLRFRLPYPDEDGILPGGYGEAFRGLRLGHSEPNPNGRGETWHDWQGNPELIESPGTLQLRHEPSGLLVNVQCFHGMKLPDLGPNARTFWNGKGHSLGLTSVKAMTDGSVVPVVTCRHCREAWRYTWDDIWNEIPEPIKSRLATHHQSVTV